MIDEKKLDDLARIIALASMDIFKGNAYREEERKLARDIWTNRILVGEEKDKARDIETQATDFLAEARACAERDDDLER
jgi:hypothetical protein